MLAALDESRGLEHVARMRDVCRGGFRYMGVSLRSYLQRERKTVDARNFYQEALLGEKKKIVSQIIGVASGLYTPACSVSGGMLARISFGCL
jgi:hypothetical protein